MLKKLTKFVLYILLPLGLISGGVYYFLRDEDPTKKSGNKSDKVLDRVYTVKKGNMIIGITQSGTVNSKKKHKLSMDAAFSTKLLWIVEENDKVKKGQILAKFEKDDLLEKIADYKLELENIDKEIEMAKEERKILESTNEADIRTAKDKLSSAEDAMKKYHKIEHDKERDSLELKVREAKKAYQTAKDERDEKQDEIKTESYKNQEKKEEALDELEDLEQTVETKKNDYNNTVLNLKMFKRYDNPNKVSDLINSVEQAKLNLKKVTIQASSKLVQKDKSINNLRIRRNRIQRNLDKHESYVPMMQLISPADGVVIYGDPDRRWGNPEIKIGMDIRRRQVLLTIPDMSKLIVKFDLPEQYRSKVRVGDKAVVTPDSIRSIKLPGVIGEIASLPVNLIHWDRNSPKIYHSTIKLKKQDSRLVSGMSVQVEIINRELKDVLFIPIEAVFEEGGNYFVYKKSLGNPKRINIRIGAANDNFVEILEGLEESDVVYLYRPYQKKGNQ